MKEETLDERAEVKARDFIADRSYVCRDCGQKIPAGCKIREIKTIFLESLGIDVIEYYHRPLCPKYISLFSRVERAFKEKRNGRAILWSGRKRFSYKASNPAF